MPPAETVRAATDVEVFVDVSCPWCHGGLATIRRLLDEVAADPALPAVRLRWRFIRLHDLEPPEGMSMSERWASWGMSEEQVAANLADLDGFLRSVGITMDHRRYSYLYNPIVAHRLLAMVRDDGGDDLPDLWSVARAVWSANFVKGVAIDDPHALRAAVLDTGVDVPERIWTRLADPQDHLAETLADRERALAVQLDGVPRFYLNGTIVPAWKPIDEVRANLRAALTAG